MTTIESLLETELLIDGYAMKAKEMPIEKQIEYLIDEHFDVFRSDESKLWRMQNLYYIITKDGEKSLFKFNPAQMDFVERYVLPGYQKIIVLKARQLGFTTLIALWFLDEIIFHPNRESLQIAHTQKDAGELFNRKIKYAIRNFCPAMKELVDMSADTKTTVEFSYGDGSRSKFNVANSGRSGTFHYLHISELAKLSKLFPSRADEVVTGTLPSVPKNEKTLVVIESTAEGVTGLFYDMYMQSYKRRDIIKPMHTVAEYKPVFYNWTWDKDQIEEATRNGCIPIKEMEESEIDWADFQKEYELSDKEITYYYIKWIEAGRDINKLNQEFPTTEMEAFISTGANYFSTKKIFKELEKLQSEEERYSTYEWDGTQFVESDKLYSDKFEGLIIYEHPQQGKNYVVGGDVAEGLMTGDWSTATVLGMDKMPKAVYRGHVDPDDYTNLVEALGKMYNTALLAIEFNKDGNWVNTELNRRGYTNMYLRTQFDDITQTVSTNFGWLTNKKTRDVALGEMKAFFNSCVNFPFKIILDEMVNFVRDKRGKPQAQSGKHDDVLISSAIAYGVLQGKVEQKVTDTTKLFSDLIWNK